MYLLLALLAAIVFAVGSIAYKRAYAEGAGVVHTLVVNNLILAVLFLPLFALESKPMDWAHWYLPALTALAYVTGHLLHVVSLRVGDVSLATPLLGAKVIFVAVLGWLIFGIELRAEQWVSAALATAGVVLMGLTDLNKSGRPGITTFLALGCSAAFACTDVMIQSWGDRFGTFNFLPFQFVLLGLLSGSALPFFGTQSLRISRVAWKWVLIGIAMSALQAILITATISLWHDAAGVNVVYATRGLWSIAFVWWIGHHVGNHERATTGTKRMGLRVAGGLLIISAVFMTTYAGQRPG
ncbi:MAG: DMT family transporter [Verrucomicrobiales bacterium]|nr:DMT family transporter [Verrucomicrobiales bacterium]